MAIAEIREDRIRVTGEPYELRYIHRIPGARRGMDGSWTMPLTLDSCTALQGQKVQLSEELAKVAGKLANIQRYIAHVKVQTDLVEPLQPVPIKAPYQLYQHQIKAYNIALALFGRGARKKAGT